MDFDRLYLQVLKYLNFRPRSEKEIRDYLKIKLSSGVIANKAKQSYYRKQDPSTSLHFVQDDELNQTEALVDLIIHKLKQQRFLNDLEFAKMWVRSRTSYKPKGEKLIRLELKQKGISNEIINEVFTDTESRVQSDLELAIEIMEKKRRKFEAMERQERFRKAGSLLARRGFNLDIIKQAIDQVFGK
ncbi:MAG TPA: regulatory protein RecX [Patescibacteria group bacterium]